MPSGDCQQCSTPNEVIVTKMKVINNKEATRRLRKLEAEVEELKASNSSLKYRLTKATKKKKDIVKELTKHLNGV